ncbi:MAG: hypothetical protein ACXWEI_05245, partial [Mycobacterium sp.]
MIPSKGRVSLSVWAAGRRLWQGLEQVGQRQLGLAGPRVVAAVALERDPVRQQDAHGLPALIRLRQHVQLRQR